MKDKSTARIFEILDDGANCCRGVSVSVRPDDAAARQIDASLINRNLL
jgi:hypothetical protein